MKQIQIIIVLVLSLTLVNCQDELTEDPKHFLVKENFYRNESDALSALTAVYSTLGQDGGFPTIWYMAMLENRADYSNGRGSQSPMSVYDLPLDNSNQSRMFDAYTDIYRGINRANAVLDNVPGIDMDEGVKKQYIAEARFLRAYFYSNLVKYWGGVPVRDHEFVDLDDIATPRATVRETWDFIIHDLEEAIPDLPASFPDSESGRATRWAAKMLLADTYLNTENWQGASDLADEVITSGAFSLIEVNEAEDFMQIYGPGVNTHSEDIWSIHHSGTNGHRIPVFIGDPAMGYSVGGFRGWVPEENSILGRWDEDDLRQEFNLFSYRIIDGDTTWVNQETPVLFRKFRDPGAPDTNNSRNNIPVFRLAEAYLIYAEAACELSGQPDNAALERLNIIRRRGYGLDLNSPSDVDYPSGMSASEFKDRVLDERAFEFVLEMKRWNDLLRTGKAQQVIEATGKAWNDVSLLLPLPVDEINNNPALNPSDQNPGY
ncbi:RagB/SusD family nutrient uptake outer membrane protein [Sinomicrobium weinanense]|uniref:RagB/SusD family nutrient uptake outer membrane protein n=1 Tax=Sinomicrobium weinanense TaxID=2842200 RepID=A0A926JS38_9FLAO|nr:RagB/SusD family nutrient uptake outer membrane protein [Sinomicrobium weinanense]MBC9796475.1 RagB/SusD family nutrient uptake outer membrane protein [Sinomicrobium weinanense]MBU3125928.1 RagB/SusD family nutrient uptake outer membrane protein [Sinomicrobium weinanense]